ncbi:MAG: LSM domain-containing protein [Promethearchaeota archaeon]
MRNQTYRLNFKNMQGNEVLIKIRLYNTYMKGILESFDQYSNLILKEAIEYKKDEETGALNEIERYNSPVLIRGDSIITISTGM